MLTYLTNTLYSNYFECSFFVTPVPVTAFVLVWVSIKMAWYNSVLMDLHEHLSRWHGIIQYLWIYMNIYQDGMV